MEIKELNDALDVLKKDLEGKSKNEVATAIEAFETKHKEVLETKFADVLAKEVKDIKADFETQLKEVKDHANKLDVKLKEKNATKGAKKDVVAEAIKENIDKIKAVRVGNAVNIEVKAVADMTLGTHLTGDAYRSYSESVAMIPNHKVNFADLIGSIPIGTGTYTFPREGGGEGSISKQTEGAAKSQIDYDLTHVDVPTDFIAGIARYSKKMANNVSYLEGFIPNALRRDYLKAESADFYGVLIAAATASTEIITGKNKIEMLMNEVAKLEAGDFEATVIAMTPADYWNILQTEKSTGAGYGLPGVVTLENGTLRINGIQIVRANWVAANKYLVGDWTTVSKVVTEGLSVQFSTEDGDNFTKNNITARVESQVGLAIHRPDAMIYGDFTAI